MTPLQTCPGLRPRRSSRERPCLQPASVAFRADYRVGLLKNLLVGAQYWACVLPVYASRFRLRVSRNTRFRLWHGLGRSGVGHLHRVILKVSASLLPPSPSFAWRTIRSDGVARSAIPARGLNGHRPPRTHARQIPAKRQCGDDTFMSAPKPPSTKYADIPSAIDPRSSSPEVNLTHASSSPAPPPISRRAIAPRPS